MPCEVPNDMKEVASALSFMPYEIRRSYSLDPHRLGPQGYVARGQVFANNTTESVLFRRRHSRGCNVALMTSSMIVGCRCVSWPYHVAVVHITGGVVV